MRKKSDKKSKHPRASVRTSRRPRRRRPVLSITSSLDADHDVAHCASCQWRAEHVPGGLVANADGVLTPLEVSSVPRVWIEVTGEGADFAELAAGAKLRVPAGAPLKSVLELLALERLMGTNIAFAIELLVNGEHRGGDHPVASGDRLLLRRWLDA